MAERNESCSFTAALIPGATATVSFSNAAVNLFRMLPYQLRIHEATCDVAQKFVRTKSAGLELGQPVVDTHSSGDAVERISELFYLLLQLLEPFSHVSVEFFYVYRIEPDVVIRQLEITILTLAASWGSSSRRRR